MLDNYLEGDIFQSQSAVITALAIFLPLVITWHSSEKLVVKDSSYGMRMVRQNGAFRSRIDVIVFFDLEYKV